MKKESLETPLKRLFEIEGVVDEIYTSTDYKSFQQFMQQIENNEYETSFFIFSNHVIPTLNDLSQLDKELTDYNFPIIDMKNIYHKMTKTLFMSNFPEKMKESEQKKVTIEYNEKEKRVLLHLLKLIKSSLIGSESFINKYVQNDLHHYLKEAVHVVQYEDVKTKEQLTLPRLNSQAQSLGDCGGIL